MAEELLNQLKKPEIDFKQFINTIQFDPDLTSVLIHTANETSDKNREISSIEKAILQIGPKRSLNVLEGINLSVQTQNWGWLPIFPFGWANSFSHAIAADAQRTWL
ncbi:MAG: HDOD domain-containing protein [Pirellulaceae bacterium]|nr:HDOD domain-containing protein [Pirellulaceae bacterium]